jgi:His/Glu/Gln/Arg/opine family amino acid ABC transporter permease subunit
LIFGACGSLTVGALDKAETNSQASLINLGNLLGFVGHFFGQLIYAVTRGTDQVGTPYHNYILSGVAVTIEFCFLAMPMALMLGLMLALMSHSPRRFLRVPARTYVEFFRDTPLIVQLLAVYWALVFLPPQVLNAFTAGLATLVLNYAAYECENLRAGIEALDRGQGEAATALGLRYGQSLRLVILPQTISIVLPPVMNDLIYMYKDSAILSLITIKELTEQASDLSRRFEFLSWQFYVLVGLVYLLLSLPLARVARLVEARLKATSFAPRRDPMLVAVLVLLSLAIVGWICGLLVHGISVTNAVGDLGQIVAGAGVTLGIMLFVFLTLGVIVYVLGSLIGQFRRGGRTTRTSADRQPKEALAPALVSE